MARTAQVSKEKQQSIMTLRHDGQMKLALTRIRISSLELLASEIATQINSSQSSSNRHISTSTVQRRLRESGLHGRIATEETTTKGN